MNKNEKLTDVEQSLLDELNYKAKLILDIEALFAKKKMPVNTKALYEFDEKKLESIYMVWKGN